MPKLMYCGECEKIVLVEEPVEGHTAPVMGGFGDWDIMWCEGPFFTSEPPTNDPDWDLQDEPSGDELFLMNLAAEELMHDLGI